ncbi:MAG: MASE1 domain-containing protein [Deltaproteobacteria bacterium]|nr:MASE1 domain-containing protein [Deltaproteobacteria bacterium]
MMRMDERKNQYALQFAFIFIFYFFTGYYGLKVGAVSVFATLIWAPSGIALFSLYRLGYRYWPAIALGAFCLNIFIGASWLTSFGISIGNTLEAVIGVYLLRKFQFDESLEKLRDVIRFAVLGALISTLFSATIGVGSLWITSSINYEELKNTWLTWWLGDVVGDIVVAPFLFIWFRKSFAPLLISQRKILFYIESLAIIFSVVVLNIGIFSGWLNIPRSYFVFPFLLWTAMRFGQRGTVAIIFLTSVVSISSLVIGYGATSGGELSALLFHLQTFLGIFALTGMIFAAAITERKLAQLDLEKAKSELEARVQKRTAALESATQRVHDLYNNAPCGYHSIDANGKFVQVNNTLLNWLGYQRDEVILKMKIIDLLNEKHLHKFNEIFPAFIKNGFARDIEFELKRKDGSWMPVLLSATAIYDSSGKFVMSRSTVIDLTERRRAEEQRLKFLQGNAARKMAETAANRFAFLSEANKILVSSLDQKNVLNRLADLIVPVLADWCIIDLVESDGRINRAVVYHRDPGKQKLAERIKTRYAPKTDAPYGPAAVIRSRKSELLPLISDSLLMAISHNEEHLELLRDAGLRSAITVPLVVRNRTLGSISLISAESHRNYGEEDLTLAEELAHRAALAVDNARLYEEAQQAIQARDDFFAIASHDLKSPVRTASLQLQLLERNAKETMPDLIASSPDFTEGLDVAKRQMKQLSGLLENFLDVVRMRSKGLEYRYEKTDLAAMVQDIFERMKEDARVAGSELILVKEEDVVGEWDKMRLEQVIVNLISNAIKFGEKKPITLSLAKIAEKIRLEVADQGCGIEKDDLKRIFGRFEQGASTQKSAGVGLGLYICKQIVLSHQGEIWVESELGKGARFIVEIPRYKVSKRFSSGEKRA